MSPNPIGCRHAVTHIQDNGGNLGGSGVNYPLRGGKYTFWQGGCRGASFVGGGKNVIPDARRGTTWKGYAHAADWYATIAALAGISDPSDGTGPEPVDGVDIYDALVSGNATDSPRKEVPLQIESDSPDNSYDLPPPDYCESIRGSDEAQHCAPPVSATAVPPLGMGSQDDDDDENDSGDDKELIEVVFPTSHSTAVESAAGAGNKKSSKGNGKIKKTKPSLRCGVLIQGRWKLISGYPGWRKTWDGWTKAPTGDADDEQQWEAMTRVGDDGPYNGTLCVAKPCLFDIESDPNEHHDVAADHQDIVKTMYGRILQLLEKEVTVKASDICPTSLGSTPDPRGTAKAVATGFWQPWL